MAKVEGPRHRARLLPFIGQHFTEGLERLPIERRTWMLAIRGFRFALS